MSMDIDVHHPTIAAKKEFSEFRRQVEILRGLLAENKNNIEAFQNLLAYQAKCAEIASSAVAGEKPLIEAPKEKKEAAPKAADIKDWEGVKVMPAPKPSMDLDGLTWVMVDEIEILNKESEDKHIFTIKEAKDSYRSRQKLKYPDGTTVEDTGRAHVDGLSEFKLLNITPGRGPAPHGLRLRRLRARDERQWQEGRHRVLRRYRPGAPLAQLAGADHARVRQRPEPDRPPAVGHRRPRHQHVPHLGLPAEVAGRRASAALHLGALRTLVEDSAADDDVGRALD